MFAIRDEMQLKDLLQIGIAGTSPMSQVGGVCVVNTLLMDTKAKRSYAKSIAALDAYEFWKAAEAQGTYKPEAGLWAPQRRAVAVSVAYLAAARAGKTSESALVKMPTGTGKTGVIATLACALPDIQRTLIITPRRSLVSQMLADIHWRFWKNFELRYTGHTLEASTAAAPKTDSEATKCGVLRLLPTTACDLYEQASDLAQEESLSIRTTRRLLVSLSHYPFPEGRAMQTGLPRHVRANGIPG